MHRILYRLVVAILAVGLLYSALGAAAPPVGDWVDHPAVQYATRPTHDPVAELARKMQAGEARLTFDGASGYLRSVLDALHVPVESQVALFLKDSSQAARISSNNPRTIFFNDSVAVGWVRGGFIEIASADPENATVFYTLEQVETDRPSFRRRMDCLSCHNTYATGSVPGRLVRGAGRYIIEHRVPFEQRWGGWYVTGMPGAIRHAGNVDLERPSDSPPATSGPALPSFGDRFDTAGYLSPYSDIVALLVFDHQMRMTNLLSRIGWEARIAGYDGASAAEAVREDATEVVDYMLFVDEAPLPGKVAGSSGFAERFAAEGPRDRRGRSLRDLDLATRLMRYPCSYMIYTPMFDALPTEAKGAIYHRLWEVLSGQAGDAKYTRLSAGDRSAVIEILRDTKKDLPAYFGA